MIFEIHPKNKALRAYRSGWVPKELELENYLISSADEEIPLLNPSIFGESLLFIHHQVKTRAGKRADILALDTRGNAIIIELKRSIGSMGVETQALQYLADIAPHKGQDFIARFSKKCPELKDNVLSFLGDDIKIENINQNNRIILMARSFDPTLLSMGEWLSDKGVAFRCITYTPIEYENKRFVSFSVAFDRTPEAIYPLAFKSTLRQPGCFWHNIGKTSDKWWRLYGSE